MEAEKFRSQARGGLEGSRPMMDVWSGLAGWLEIPGYLGRQGAAIRSRVRAWPVGTAGGGGALSLCCWRESCGRESNSGSDSRWRSRWMEERVDG